MPDTTLGVQIKVTIVPFIAEEKFPGDSDGKESTCNAGDLGLIPRSGRSPPGEALQYSSLENPIDREPGCTTQSMGL